MHIEILETLATICLYISWNGHYPRSIQEDNMRQHYYALKELSETLRGTNDDKGISRKNNY